MATRPHSSRSFERNWQTCRHSLNAIFEKNVTRLDKYAQVLSESDKCGASSHCLLTTNYTKIHNVRGCKPASFTNLITPYCWSAHGNGQSCCRSGRAVFQPAEEPSFSTSNVGSSSSSSFLMYSGRCWNSVGQRFEARCASRSGSTSLLALWPDDSLTLSQLKFWCILAVGILLDRGLKLGERVDPETHRY